MDLVPIRVTIGIKSDKKKRSHAYPDFNSIREHVSSWDDGSDWSHYVDRYSGWLYDNKAGHSDDDPDGGSPRGVWIGVLLVPEDFADAAEDAFPSQVKVIEESECKAFYEVRHAFEQPEILEDVEVLQAIVAKKQLGIDDPGAANALDPEHPSRGRKRNKLKTWDGYKQKRGVTINEQASKRLRDRSQRRRMDP